MKSQPFFIACFLFAALSNRAPGYLGETKKQIDTQYRRLPGKAVDAPAYGGEYYAGDDGYINVTFLDGVSQSERYTSGLDGDRRLSPARIQTLLKRNSMGSEWVSVKPPAGVEKAWRLKSGKAFASLRAFLIGNEFSPPSHVLELEVHTPAYTVTNGPLPRPVLKVLRANPVVYFYLFDQKRAAEVRKKLDELPNDGADHGYEKIVRNFLAEQRGNRKGIAGAQKEELVRILLDPKNYRGGVAAGATEYGKYEIDATVPSEPVFGIDVRVGWTEWRLMGDDLGIGVYYDEVVQNNSSPFSPEGAKALRRWCREFEAAKSAKPRSDSSTPAGVR